jgi:2-amino-4-hydroxy-6-hydroxymethyldihydropteridine diphosphokinase
MSLILATGSNLGESLKILNHAQNLLSHQFDFEYASRIYFSGPVDYLEQPNFYNQVLQFSLPKELNPQDVLEKIQKIENECGGHTAINKGPRYLDIDILFWDTQIVNLENLTIPHPAIAQRSFVLLPLREIPFYKKVKDQFQDINQFSSWAKPVDPNH